jgi:ribosomal protein S18 acetylase RimI-like enzyme
LSEVEVVVAASYEKYLSRMDKPPAPLYRDYAEAIGMRQIWVVGRPLNGLISLIPESDAVLLIENIAVHPSAQGSGLGRRLMAFAEREATERGLSRLMLYTSEAMTENVALYQHLGFSEVGRRTEDGYRRIYLEKWLPVGADPASRVGTADPGAVVPNPGSDQGASAP